MPYETGGKLNPWIVDLGGDEPRYRADQASKSVAAHARFDHLCTRRRGHRGTVPPQCADGSDVVVPELEVIGAAVRIGRRHGRHDGGVTTARKSRVHECLSL